MRIISNKNIYFSERKERQCPPFSHSEWIKFAIFALIVRPKKKKLQMSKHITEEQRYAISMMLQIPMSKKAIAEAIGWIALFGLIFFYKYNMVKLNFS